MNKLINEKGAKFYKTKDIRETKRIYIRTFIITIQILMKHL